MRPRVAFIGVHNSCRSQIAETLGKLLAAIPPVDIVIRMGCNVECPYLPYKCREDWGLDDPTDKSDTEFIAVIQSIEQHILHLKQTLM